MCNTEKTVKHTFKKYYGVTILRFKVCLTTFVNIKYDIYKTQKKAVLKKILLGFQDE